MNIITDWKIKITWSDGKIEWLDYLPNSEKIRWYLDQLEEERNWKEE
tara:strand:+ start:241 stop:381 length:141 start_codon:yes stop_codon:yes gene_type:complete